MVTPDITTPLLTWGIIVAAMIVLIVITAVTSAHTRHNNRTAHSRKLIEIGNERDEFFVPGDRREIDRYDCEDF